jgi:hypothetical protein
MKTPIGIFFSIIFITVTLFYLLEIVQLLRFNHVFSYPTYNRYEYYPNYVHTDYLYQPYYNWKNYYLTYSYSLPEYVTQTVEEYWY